MHLWQLVVSIIANEWIYRNLYNQLFAIGKAHTTSNYHISTMLSMMRTTTLINITHYSTCYDSFRVVYIVIYPFTPHKHSVSNRFCHSMVMHTSIWCCICSRSNFKHVTNLCVHMQDVCSKSHHLCRKVYQLFTLKNAEKRNDNTDDIHSYNRNDHNHTKRLMMMTQDDHRRNKSMYVI